MNIKSKHREIGLITKKLKVLNNHELLKTAYEHGKLSYMSKRYLFKTEMGHNGKAKVTAYSYGTILCYWYIIQTDGILTIDSGHTITELKQFLRTYKKQFNGQYTN